MIRRVLLLAVAVLLSSSAAFAQDDQSHWGVAVNVNPTWKVPSNLKMLWDGEIVDIKSQDFAIGIARGKTLGGDWSVNYVRKNFKDGSFVDSTEVRCNQQAPGCFTDGSKKTLRSVKLSGIEAIKFIKIANIKDRVQIGLNVGGGIGSLSGDVDVIEYDTSVSCGNTGCRGTQTQRAFTVDAGAEICDGGDCDRALFALPKFALGKVELAVGFIVAPGLKIRAAGGLDFPGTSMFNISGVYLFGAK
jgi:hypothetical protein